MTEATVLSLVPTTLAATGVLKASLADAASALDSGSLTIALRDNGPKINGTLVLVEGKAGHAGDAFDARNARNQRAYGTHTVLGTVEYSFGTDGTPSFKVSADTLIDVDVATFKAPVFGRA